MSYLGKCICCESSSFTLISEGLRDSKDFSVIKCNVCDLVQLDKMPSIYEDKTFYDKDGQARPINMNSSLDEIRKKLSIDNNRRVKLIEEIEKQKNNTRILDIGAGYGFFIEIMENKEYNIEGIEISSERLEIARRLCKGNIYQYNLLADSIPPSIQNKYDIITLFQVLEHISSPIKFVKKIKSLLNKRGKVVIEVPNVGDHLLNISSSYRKFYWQRAHVCYYSVETLKSILEQADFRVLSIFGVQRYGVKNMMNWVINGEPQLKTPSYFVEDSLEWLEDYYRSALIKKLECDTLIIVGESN